MKTRMTAIIVCLAVASVSALAPKIHTPAAAAPKAAHKKVPNRKLPAKTAVPAALAKTYASMPQAERLDIQSDLALTNYYEGNAGGDIDERAIAAIKAFQKANGGKETGILSDEERAHLAAAAAAHKQAVGWQVIDDPETGVRFGLPEKLVSPLGPSRTGSRWISGHGQIQIDVVRLSEASLPVLFDEEKKTPRGRRVESSALTSDSFVISGTQGLKNFVVRAQSSGDRVRGITILYDQATAGIMGPVAVAVANSFQGFPDASAALPPGQRRAVEYGTAIVVDRSGDLVASGRGTADCAAIMVPGFGHAVRIAAEEADDLALIRLYGARDLVPAALDGDSQGDDLTLIGIADPSAQGGGDTVTKTAARLDGRGIEPAPKTGFSGAAAIDAQGRFAGMVELKSQLVAGNDPVTQQATLVTAAAVRAFLVAHGITPAAGPGPVDQSVVRVICVRK